MSAQYMIIPSPVGPLTLAEEDGAFTHLLFQEEVPSGYAPGETALLRQAALQLEEYFAGQRQAFRLPLRPSGTEFQLRVWAALQNIPYGQTRTYRDIAQAAGCPKGYRAVGMANHNNPISIIVPCHRVIGSDGKLTGYGGGLHVKEFLLRLEQEHRS